MERIYSITLMAFIVLALSGAAWAEGKPATEVRPAAEEQPTAEGQPAMEGQPATEVRPAAEEQPTAEEQPAAEEQPTADGQPTKVPERLEYEISYGIFDVGKSVMEVVNNKDGTVSIITRARSEGWVDDVYPVDDYAESVVEDFTTLRPIKYTLKTREGKGRKHREVLFDMEGLKATYTDHLKKINSEYEIPDRVFDPLAAFFYTRRLILEPGNNQQVPMFDSKKFWPLEVKVIKRQKIKVPAGEFDTVIISPVMQSEGIFSRKGDMFIWVTDDERRVPVLIKSKVLIGSIKVKLIGGDF